MVAFALFFGLWWAWVAALTAKVFGCQKVSKAALAYTLPLFVILTSLLLYAQVTLGRNIAYLGCVGLSWTQCRSILGPPLGGGPSQPPALPDVERRGWCYLYRPGGRVDNRLFCIMVDERSDRVRAVFEVHGK